MSQATSAAPGRTIALPCLRSARALTEKSTMEATSFRTSTVTTAQAGLKGYRPPLTLAAFLIERSMEMERAA